MNLSQPVRYNCTDSDILSWDVSSRDGKMVAAYVTIDKNFHKLFYSTLNSSSCNSPYLVRMVLTSTPISRPQISFLNSNNIALAWTELPSKIKYSTIELLTQEKTNFEPCNTLQACKDVRVIKDEPGTVASWTEGTNATCKEIKFQRYNQESNATHTIMNACAVGIADITVENKNTILTWSQNIDYARYDIDIKAQVFSADNKNITSILTINTFKSGEQSSPSIASTNSVVGIVWRSIEQVDSHDVFFRALHINGTFVSTAMLMNRYTTGAQTAAVIAANNGVFAIGWTSKGQDNGSLRGVYGQLIFANGTKIGSEFRINKITAGDQKDLKINAGPGDSFTFAWLGPYLGKRTMFSRTIDISEYVDEQSQDVLKTPTLTAQNIKTATMTSTETTTYSASLSSTATETNTPPVTLTPTVSTSPSITQATTASPTHSKSIVAYPAAPEESEEPVMQTRPTTIPPQAKKASQATASVVSALSVISPANAGMGSRINGVAAVASCEEHFYRNNTFTLSENYAPSFSFLIGDIKDEDAYSNLIYSSALLVGSFALLAGVAYFAPPALVGIKVFAAIAIHFPGNFLPLSMFLSAAAITSSATILKFGSRGSKVAAGFSLASQIVSLGHYGYRAFTIKKHAEFENNKWVAQEGEEKYTKMHRVAFQDYREDREWFVGVDIGMNLASNFLPGWKPGALSECSPMIHSTTALYGAYTIAQLALQPHAAMHHKLANSAINLLTFGTAALSSIQEIWPQHKNNTKINDAINTMPIAATGIATINGLYDLGTTCKKLYDKPQDVPQKNTPPKPPIQHAVVAIASSSSDDDNAQPLLQVNPLHGNTHKSFQGSQPQHLPGQHQHTAAYAHPDDDL